jgi:dienelactone hydrolase
MRDNPGSESSPCRRFGIGLLGAIVLSFVGLAFTATPGEAGLFGSANVKKSVSTFTSNGHRVTVWRYEPKTKGRHPALVMLHGLECLGESPKRYELFAERFAAKGYAVYFVHYFNCTPILAKDVPAIQERVKASLRPLPDMMPDEEVRKHFQDWMAAIKGAVRFARAQECVDPERVALLGFSLGGFLTMSLVATEPDLGLCAVVECFGGLPKELHETLKKTPPVLIFHGDRDTIVPVKEAHTLRALLKERKCHVEDMIFENCGHMWLGDNGSVRLDRALEAERICVRFLDRHVKNGKNGVKKSGN